MMNYSCLIQKEIELEDLIIIKKVKSLQSLSISESAIKISLYLKPQMI